MSRLDNWDKTVRTQYEYKTRDKPHPYGIDEEPNHFRDFHIFTKLRMLYQLAVWTFHNPDRMRQHFPEVDWEDQYVEWVCIASLFHALSCVLTTSSKHIQPAGTVKTVSITSCQETDSTAVKILPSLSRRNRSPNSSTPRKRPKHSGENQGHQSGGK